MGVGLLLGEPVLDWNLLKSTEGGSSSASALVSVTRVTLTGSGMTHPFIAVTKGFICEA